MSTELTTVYLVGSLGKAVGRSEWKLDVKSPAEAIRAIDINTRGALARHLSGPARDRMYRMALQKRDNLIDVKEATNRSGRSTIYIMPTLRGRNSGAGKIFAGIALLVLTYFTGGLAAGASGWAGAGAATTAAGVTTAGSLTLAGSIAIGFGISLVLGGISQLLTPGAQGPNANPEQAQSTAFPGNATTVVQGTPVPIVYGRALVSPVPVAITITNNDVSTSAAGTQGTVDIFPIDGGGTQYGPRPINNGLE